MRRLERSKSATSWFDLIEAGFVAIRVRWPVRLAQLGSSVSQLDLMGRTITLTEECRWGSSFKRFRFYPSCVAVDELDRSSTVPLRDPVHIYCFTFTRTETYFRQWPFTRPAAPSCLHYLRSVNDVGRWWMIFKGFTFFSFLQEASVFGIFTVLTNWIFDSCSSRTLVFEL